MPWLDEREGFETIDALGKARTPFLFIVSYDKSKIVAQPLSQLDSDIFYKLETWRNYPVVQRKDAYSFEKFPADFATYQAKLERVQKAIREGRTYLLNLTCKTPMQSSLSLEEIFTYARAKFKLYFKGQFTCFSPERFIEIKGREIATYPMKGTIDADVPQAKQRILEDAKEMAEHVMIVDLMRNDLGIVGERVRVERFRYVEKVRAGEKMLLQVSSKITATLPENWHDSIGTLLSQMLPAGSITGTPKRSTVDIIRRVESYERDFYTGVFGLFDGNSIRSGVMIRFIEESEGKLYYKSGGGITVDSDAMREYDELVDKIYLPF